MGDGAPVVRGDRRALLAAYGPGAGHRTLACLTAWLPGAAALARPATRSSIIAAASGSGSLSVKGDPDTGAELGDAADLADLL